MNIHIPAPPAVANAAAASLLASWLREPEIRTLMVAAGNTPLDLYAAVGALRLPLPHLRVFALDEYVGVPPDEPRNCANLLRRSVAEAWAIPPGNFFTVSSVAELAPASIREHERRIEDSGGLDVIVLGLGQNGHLGFNEPGSAEDSGGRLLDLDPISIEANRKWFGGAYAPAQGVTVGLRTILASRRIIILAYGNHKKEAVAAMTRGPRHAACPASFLQGHACVHLFLDRPAAEAMIQRG